MNKNSSVDLLHGSILKSMLIFAIPLFFSSVFRQLYNTMDAVIIGHTLGDEALAAMGAAGATVSAQGVSVICCLIYIGKKVKLLIPEKKHFVWDKELYQEMLSQGLSMGFMSCIVTSGTAILQSGINNLGYLVIAGHTAARKLFQFLMMPNIAMNQTVSTFVSQNYGAGQIGRINKAMKCAYLYGAAVAFLASVLMFLFAPAAVGLLSGSSERVVLENGALYLRVVAPCLVILGLLNPTRQGLQAIGQKLLPAFWRNPVIRVGEANRKIFGTVN